MIINPPTHNPLDFYYAHKDDEAVITASFPGGVPYFSFSTALCVKLEKLLQDHRDKIVDARYCPMMQSALDTMKEEDHARYQAQYFVDDELPENPLTYKSLPEGNMCLKHVIIDFSDEEGKAFCQVSNKRDDGKLRRWGLKIVTQTSERLDQIAEMVMSDYYYDRGFVSIGPRVARLGLLSRTSRGLGVSDVILTENRLMEHDDLELHFGAKIHNLQSHLKESLTEHASGFHLLQGAPGTGKTSFLNHLTAILAETHRLIYLPISSFHLVSSPDSIDFWMRLAERARTGQRNVLLIEDAEGLIQSRDEINVSQGSMVSTLLNLTDGLLGNVLNLHVIATINTDYEKIDKALLRAGRLRTYYEFEGLDYSDAKRLADHLGITIQDDEKEYTLGEIYNGATEKPVEKASLIGFQASA